MISKRLLLLGTIYYFSFLGIANGETINISLSAADWQENPHYSSHQVTDWTKSNTSEGLRVVTNELRGPNGGMGTFIRTVDSFDVVDTTIRYKWKAIGQDQYYSSYGNGLNVWNFAHYISTHNTWNGSVVIPVDTWIYTQARIGSDNSWYYNFSYAGYATSGGFLENSGMVSGNPIWSDTYRDVHLMFGVNDNYTEGAGFVVSEATLETSTDPVPEPATILLFGIGLVGLAGTTFRKKKD